jgi:hypothetical protein
MIKYNDYDYVKMGHYTNVVAELRKGRSPDAAIHMCAFMEPLISKLALTHPEWTIVANDAYYNQNKETYTVTKFTIYEGTEVMGRIHRDGWHDDNFKYELLNERVEKSRAKRGGMRTKDMKKALKAVEGFFAPKTLEERRVAAVTGMRSHIQNTAWRATRMLNDAVQGVIPALATYLLANMDEVRAALESAGASTSGLDNIPLRLEPCKALWQIETSRINDEGTIVVLMGDSYMLIPDKNPTLPVVKTAAQLDPAMAAKIGVLKVFDKNDEALEDIGMRFNATTFYLLP